jgi:sec-independent protein translocase protein TatA
MFGIGPTELIVIALILVLLFGAKKIPDLMKGLGSGIKEFKKASNVDDDDKEREREQLRIEREQLQRERDQINRELPR